MQNATRLRRLVVALALLLFAASSGPVDAVEGPKPAKVVLSYDCSNMRNPTMAVEKTRYVKVEFVRLGKYRWRLRAHPRKGHAIHADLWEEPRSHQITATHGRLVNGSMEWVIPIRILDGCNP